MCVIADNKNIMSSWNRSLEKSAYYKVTRFNIKHLQAAENKGDYFLFKNTPFRYVYFNGQILCKSTYRDKVYLIVNDFSHNITCVVKESYLVKTEQDKIKYSQNSDLTEGDENSTVFEAALMTREATNYLADWLPNTEDIRVRQMVAVSGKLKEYNGERYVSVTKINVSNNRDQFNNAAYQRDIYRDIYRSEDEYHMPSTSNDSSDL